jgi:hypothetical protein
MLVGLIWKISTNGDSHPVGVRVNSRGRAALRDAPGKSIECEPTLKGSNKCDDFQPFQSRDVVGPGFPWACKAARPRLFNYILSE